MAIWERRTATGTKPTRIEDPRLAVSAELRTGIIAAYKAIDSSEHADQQAGSSDANLAYAKALDLMTKAQIALTDPILLERLTHFEELLRRINSLQNRES
jgi:hypothetical protein